MKNESEGAAASKTKVDYPYEKLYYTEAYSFVAVETSATPDSQPEDFYLMTH